MTSSVCSISATVKIIIIINIIIIIIIIFNVPRCKEPKG